MSVLCVHFGEERFLTIDTGEIASIEHNPKGGSYMSDKVVLEITLKHSGKSFKFNKLDAGYVLEAMKKIFVFPLESSKPM